MLKEVEALKAEIAKLRGQTEVQAHQLDTLDKRQTDLYADLDQRLTELAKAAKPRRRRARRSLQLPLTPAADTQVNRRL